MTYGSVCSGIEAATVAWHPLGWRPAFFAEIEPFPSAVLKHHYPEVPNLGDFTTISDYAGPVDVLVGGTPCQGFSVAGLRRGLADDRSNLALEFLRLADRLRPVWVVWENVPGVLSTNGGRDFGAFLGGLGELGYGWAYRILDAQHFGVPQRRRRVFVVGHLGDWRRAVAVLFERDCLSGHPAPRRQAQSGVATSVTPGARRTSGARSGEQLTVARSLTAAGQRLDGDSDNFVPEVAFCLKAEKGRNENGSHVGQGWNTNYIAHILRADGFDASEDGTGRGTPLVPVPIDMRQASRGELMTNNRPEGSSGGAPGTGIGEPGDPSPSIALSHPPAVAFQNTGQGWWNQNDTATTIRTPQGSGSLEANLVAFDPHGNCVSDEGTAPTLKCRDHGAAGHGAAVAFQCHGSDVGSLGTLRSGRGDVQSGVPFIINAAESCARQSHARPSEVARCLDSTGSFANAQGGTVVADLRNMAESDVSPTLQVGSHGPSPSNHPHVADSMAVRRLTPRECERLQGFPDDYTLISVKPVPAKSQAKARTLHATGDARFAEINGVMYFVAADGPRYKALGNSMAVPVMRWIGERIMTVSSCVLEATDVRA